ncbi:MAG: hypothetical protein Ct9H300mP20_14320 [Gammaproteobacteria bacterium]|nr:MAG: hypothetical protein Ct9H300mP20_14320 [Gammaproteobacteria bacterium]
MKEVEKLLDLKQMDLKKFYEKCRIQANMDYLEGKSLTRNEEKAVKPKGQLAKRQMTWLENGKI